MKIWVDIITPKDLKFFKPMVEKLEKKHAVLCTTRVFNEVIALAKIHKFKVVAVGRYGGGTKEGKLDAAIERMGLLTKKIKIFKPDLLISFCSPDACRVAYGLGIKQIAFNDTPHAIIPHPLSMPLIDKLLIPLLVPKKSYSAYGIAPRDIIQYDAIDAAYMINQKTITAKLPFDKSKKNILIRMPEDYATYMPKTNYMPIIKKIMKKFQFENIVIITRYKEQRMKLSKIKDAKFKVIDMKYDGKFLLENCDVFVGTGGTMTAEACMMGIPCVIMNLFRSNVLDFLFKKKLLKIAKTSNDMTVIIKKLLKVPTDENKRRAKAIVDSMDDPYDTLVKTMRTMFGKSYN